MAKYRRQHFVPRCYLRPFSHDSAGSAIELYNIASNKHISDAPLKGQCARSHFYGDDLILERAFQVVENQYASVLRKIEGRPEQVTDADLRSLRYFAHLQFVRTEKAIERVRSVYQGMQDAAYRGIPVEPEQLDLTHKRLLRSSMRSFLEFRHAFDDLKICVIRNRTKTDFVTSDDPSIFTNRFHFQRLRKKTFGFASSGAMLILPLSPRFAFFCYDGQVYSLSEREGCYVSTTNEADVTAINQLQYIKASQNIYFASPIDAARIEHEFRNAQPLRPPSWERISILVPERTSENGQWYKRAKDEQLSSPGSRLVLISPVHPEPRRWFSKLAFRTRITSYNNGSGIGHVRKREWLTSDSFKSAAGGHSASSWQSTSGWSE